VHGTRSRAVRRFGRLLRSAFALQAGRPLLTGIECARAWSSSRMRNPGHQFLAGFWHGHAGLPTWRESAQNMAILGVVMFTGIVEHLGTIRSLKVEREGGRVEIAAPSLASSLAVANSVAVNGCCLTVVSLQGERFFADLSGETIRRTSFAANGHG